MTLLVKTRRLNRLLQKSAGSSVVVLQMAEMLKDILHSNVYILHQKNKLLGHAIHQDENDSEINQVIINEKKFPIASNDLFSHLEETFSNVESHHAYTDISEQMNDLFDQKFIMIVPLVGSSHRLGTLVLTRNTQSFQDEDFIIAEYGATVLAMDMLREQSELVEQESRGKAIVQVAISSLSYSELEAIEHIFEELDGKDGLLVASKIADRVGITRSVIVNALRKLESASVIESRSLGMKGTYIRILNDQFIGSIQQIKKN
jgi:transcriptional pleiotropic repressor